MVNTGMARLARLRSRIADAGRALVEVAEPDDLEPRIVWIMGSPRTGSTWLLNLMAVLADAATIDEPLIGAHLAVSTGVITDHAEEGTPELLYDASSLRPDYFFSERHADVWRPALRELLLRRFAAGGTAHGDRPVLVKEPNGSLAAPILTSCLPRSRLLFLVRDGRDVVDSMLDGLDGGWISDHLGVDVSRFGGRGALLEVRARRWVRDIEAVQRAYDAHDPQRRSFVRYEDLLADTAGELERLLGWLHLPVDPARARRVADQLHRDRVPADQKGAGKFLRAATAGLWRDHFDEREKAALHAIMGPTLRRLGYDDPGPRGGSGTTVPRA